MNPNVNQMVIESLKEKGFDGLHYDNQCGCLISALAPCGQISKTCTAGYKVVPPEDSECGFDFYICDSKKDRPWE